MLCHLKEFEVRERWMMEIEVGSNDMSLELNNSNFFKFTWKLRGGPSDCMISRARDTDAG